MARQANVVLGFWLILAPFIFGLTGLARWNAIGVGVVIVLLAGYNTVQSTSNRGPATVTLFASMYFVVSPSMFLAPRIVVIHDPVVGGIVAFSH